jgi:hypothetical protein
LNGEKAELECQHVSDKWDESTLEELDVCRQSWPVLLDC